MGYVWFLRLIGIDVVGMVVLVGEGGVFVIICWMFFFLFYIL